MNRKVGEEFDCQGIKWVVKKRSEDDCLECDRWSKKSKDCTINPYGDISRIQGNCGPCGRENEQDKTVVFKKVGE